MNTRGARGGVWYNRVVDGSQVFLFAEQIAAILLTLGSIDKNPAEQDGGYLVGDVMKRKQIPSGQRMRILRENNFRCAYCGSPATAVDHILPYSYSPQNVDKNLIAVCEVCNSIAYNKVFDGFIDKQSYILHERGKRRWQQKIAQQIYIPMPTYQESLTREPEIKKPKKVSQSYYEIPIIVKKVEDTPQKKWNRIRRAIEKIAGL